MLKNRTPAELTKHDNAATRYFAELVNQSFPSYSDLCSRRYSIDVLLHDACYFVDLAYVTAAWRYSQALGANGRSVFPPGLFAWPPADSDLPVNVA
jgi:hypothetical protein